MSNGITIDRSFLVGLSNRAIELDKLITDALGTSANAGKRAQINALVKATTVDVSSIVAFLDAAADTPTRIGLWNKIVDAVEAKYDAEFNKYLDDQIAAQPKVEPIPTAELDKLLAERKELANQWTASHMIMTMMNPGENFDDIPAPKKMLYARGPRGPRAISSYQFSINGKDLSAEENSLKQIALKSGGVTKDDKGADVPWKARNLQDHGTTALKQGDPSIELDWKNPPDKFEFELPNGTLFGARKMTTVTDPDDDGDDDLVNPNETAEAVHA